MYNWKKARSLAAMEMRESASVFVSIAIIVLTGLLFSTVIGNYADFGDKNAMMLFDILFAFLFIFMPASFTTAKFTPMQRSKTGTDSAPGVVMLLQLPVNRDIIGKSRFIINMVYTAIYAVLIIPCFYLISPFREQLSPLQFIAFGIFWLCFALYIGGGSKLGADFYTKPLSAFKVAASFIVLFASIAAVHYLFTYFFGTGVVHTSLTAARQQPLLTAIASLALAAIGLHFAHLHNVKIMKNKDFL